MPDTQALIEFLDRNIPPRQGRKTARALGITASHLGELRHGRVRPGSDLCRRIAEYYGIAEVDVLRMAGYLKDQGNAGDPVEELITAASEQLRRDTDLQEIARAYLATRSPSDRRRIHDVVLAAAGVPWKAPRAGDPPDE